MTSKYHTAVHTDRLSNICKQLNVRRFVMFDISLVVCVCVCVWGGGVGVTRTKKNKSDASPSSRVNPFRG
jgi:hypothetical protein